MMRWLTSLLLLLSLPLSAQLDVSLFHRLKPREVGPAGMSGRVTTIDVDLNNPSTIFIGTASGGVWRSTSGGTSWEPVFDEQSTQAIGALAIDQSNPSVIWVGTGEGNPRNSHNSGNGIYRSLDGGNTWQHMGLEATKTIHRVIIDPRNSDVVYAATLGSIWGNNPERGVYKTTDGGKSWQRILYRDDSTGCADLVMDPSNPNKLIAAMWTYGRKPWFFNSGGTGSGLFISYDGGATWLEKGKDDGLPAPPYGRMGLAIAPGKPNVVYALVEADKLGLYRSTDGGKSWSLRTRDDNMGNRPFYYADIFVDPQNENRLYSLWSLLSRSEDGGKSFEILAGWDKLHPDHHAFWVSPNDPDFIIAGNDGGLGISHDGGNNWRFVENLPVAQYYHINYDMDLPYNIYGGMQDNGSWIGPAYVWRRGGIRNQYFQELYFGDGFDVVPVPGNSRYGYAMSQGGNVARYDRETGATVFIQPVHPEGEFLRFHWNAGIAQDPFNPDALYFGSQYLHYSTDRGESWSIISPDLTTNDPAKQEWAKSGGLTIDATNAENHTTILTIAPSALNENVIWVGTDDGNVQLTRDKGATWTNTVAKMKGLPAGSWIPQIVASPHNEAEAWVIANNYRRNDWTPYAYHTDDFGKTWTRIAGPDNIQGHCLSIVQDAVEPRLLFLGTDQGLYVSFDKGGSWQQWKHGYPSVNTIDLHIHPRESDLIIGTFGRSAYILDDIQPMRTLIAQPQKATQPVALLSTTTGYLAEYQQPSGSRFNAQADYEGQNRRPGVMVTYHLPKTGQWSDFTEDSTAKDFNWKKLAITVYDANGDTIRHYTMKADTGLQRTYWDMRMNGFRFPSNREAGADDDLPPGAAVLPGNYLLELRYGSFTDTATVAVETDPRMSFNRDGALAQLAAGKELQAIVGAATTAYDNLLQMEKTIKTVEQSLANADEDTRDAHQKLVKSLREEITRLKALYMTPEDFAGIDGEVRLMDHLYGAAQRIRSAEGQPGSNAMTALQVAATKTAEVVEQVNTFLEKDWTDYMETVAGYDKPLFPELAPVDPPAGK